MDLNREQEEEPVLTVVVRRTVKAGREADFESAMRSFVAFALNFEGNRGINVIRPSGGAREYIVVDRFSDRNSRDQFTASPEYGAWMDCLGNYTDGFPRIQELSGLESWFSDTEGVLRTPPKYKMALVTWIGVSAAIFLLNILVAPYIKTLAYVPGVLFFNACVVALLTWGVMPVLTMLFSRWLFKKESGSLKK